MLGVDYEFEFPAELLGQPAVPVAVSGLDTVNNAVHRAVWDAFLTCRQERLPILFQLLAPDHEFPRPKPPKSYDMYIPKGILKRAWLPKHLTLVPALVVLFYDLDWTDPHFEEKKLELTSRVESMRAALDGRPSRVCVVLIQHKDPLPSGDDPGAADKAAALLQSAELSNKSLFALPHTDSLYGYASRLQKVFLELASSYYQHQCRLVKQHKELLNKKTHHYLYVRHQFKQGFFSELRQDLVAAHMHYSEAYSNLLEVRISDTNELEVKTIAGFLAYKMCRLLFLVSRPRDAISQFKAHVEHYRHVTGHKQLLFQHYAWLSKQFSVFAELFDEMIQSKRGPATQTQHPGFYYQLAAKHAEQRKALALELCSAVSSYPEPDPLAGWESLDFYGQRPWRPCRLSAEPVDPDRERQGIQAIMHREKHLVNHSSIIIGLLGNAISQYKTYRCPRMRRHLVVQMADEYYASKEYGKALTLLTHMLWDYRGEGWSRVVRWLGARALAAAYLTLSLQDWPGLALEALAAEEEPGQAAALAADLAAFVSGAAPRPPAACPPAPDPHGLRDQWARARLAAPLTLDSAALGPALACKAAITRADYQAVHITVALRYQLPAPLPFTRLAICLASSPASIPTQHTVCPGAGYEDGSWLEMKEGEVKTFHTVVIPQPGDVSKLLQVTSVLLYLGEVEGRTVMIKFSGGGAESLVTFPELARFKRLSPELRDWESLVPVLSGQVAGRPPLLRLAIAERGPALLNEWFPLQVRLDNQEPSPISAATLHLTSTQLNIEVKRRDGDREELLSLPLVLPLEEPALELVPTLLVRSSGLGSRQLSIKVAYQVEGQACEVEESWSLDVMEPWSWSWSYLSLRCEPLETLPLHESFIARLTLTCRAPGETTLTSSQLTLDKSVELVSEGSEDVLRGLRLGPEEAGSWAACLRLAPAPAAEGQLLAGAAVGTLSLAWGRAVGAERSQGYSQVPLPPLPPAGGSPSPLTLTLDLPATGTLRRPLLLRYTLANHTHKLITLGLSMDASEAFMFQGFKQRVVNIAPGETRPLVYCVNPLLVGLVNLPRIKLSAAPSHAASEPPILSSAQLAALTNSSLPPSIFVLPEVPEESGQPPPQPA